MIQLFLILVVMLSLDYVQGKWPEKFSLVHRKLTQKCTDLYNSKKELRDE
jgi:hypothetical protein